MEELAVYLSEPGWWSVEGIELDPRFDPVREHPRYQALVAEHSRQL